MGQLNQRNRKIRNRIVSVFPLLAFVILLSSYQNTEVERFTLTVKVTDLRNSDGVVQFALYNKEGSIPDEHYEKYYRKMSAKITKESSFVTFTNLPSGKYAVNILHDENKNSKIDKGFFLPVEGLGFSNFQSFGIANRPTFEKASFQIVSDKKMKVKVIYM